ncbi:Dihydrofolate reductase [Microtus ochrogaster]|uniref:Dihydrofolate reductase n=1 Tax=Microtus ochrogaster TaxID=79684 RepID=A0A8J6G8Q0_MICOH|nr:Dihydrofolate reductase [Microtus ochrogaster]
MVRTLNCIVAVSQNMGIGKNGDLPWPLLRYCGRTGFGRPKRFAESGRALGGDARADLLRRSRERVGPPAAAPACARGDPPAVATFAQRRPDRKQNLVIMGRKTWFSIPEKNRPLKDRINIVLRRELKEPPQGAHFLAKSLDDALKLIEQPELANKVDMVWIVGGSSVYKEAMDQPGHLRLFITRIMQEFESDTFFPEIDLGKYKLLPEYPGVLSEVQEEKGIKYKFEVYEKKG